MISRPAETSSTAAAVNSDVRNCHPASTVIAPPAALANVIAPWTRKNFGCSVSKENDPATAPAPGGDADACPRGCFLLGACQRVAQPHRVVLRGNTPTRVSRRANAFKSRDLSSCAPARQMSRARRQRDGTNRLARRLGRGLPATSALITPAREIPQRRRPAGPDESPE